MSVKLNGDNGWDLLIDNRHGQLTLEVEVKSKTNVSAEWAAKFRRNIIAHGTLSKAPYFMMAFPDKFYLWANPEINQDDSAPTYQVDASKILNPYFERARVTAEEISGESLEVIIASWLDELVYIDKLPEDVKIAQPWLIESGLYDVLSRGLVEQRTAA
jgi:hypothetical protein